ncbi:Asparagine synthase family protein [Striga hermonthica]|uniref:Asparagine synthase family protein n=1 Tax=Striga hermonthica TaxID=68872 RepID=A0A9N7RFD0_STRHE|nr:Asparagine synthase family protein [Striga hermonthica]
MCGIALIVSGIDVDLSCLFPNFDCPSPLSPSQTSLFSEEDIRAALQRRGPDSLGTHTVNVCSNFFNGQQKHFLVQSIAQKEFEGATENGRENNLQGKLRFIGATLQLRGDSPVSQPVTDAFGNVLVYNGEIYGGIHIGSDSSDTQVLMKSLGQCCSCTYHGERKLSTCSGENNKTVPELLSSIKGPWALIYWQDSTKTLWFGRDAFGRRSLLVHWPTHLDPRLLLSSVSPLSSILQHFDIDDEKGKVEVNFWDELPCGVYSISMSPMKPDGHVIGKVKKHEWTDSGLKDLVTWERTCIQPKSKSLNATSFRNAQTMEESTFSDFEFELESVKSTLLAPSHKVMMALRESIMRRTTLNRVYKDFLKRHRKERHAPIAVLFSGGLDSMIIAALLHQCVDSEYDVDLLNVSFDGDSAPDRVSGRAGLKELQKIAPSRRWNLIEIDADLLKLTSETKHVMALINPSKTYMDLNIGIALWLAAGGDGWLYHAECERVKYKSTARILLVGSGADEQCAGYGRHKTKFRNKSWLGLHDEMKLDMQRIWKRNLGRDDRCLADNAKEARFPFLDEDVIRTLLDIPLWEIADLDQPSGVGDKKVLREVARLLGLNVAACLPKRAIQFGSRIARESNKKNFGSNRAANQASAGSVVIYGSSNNNTSVA